ncbi:MAG: LysR family transcriptional regulator [Phyllobacteriaceae bacterium]|nr:LysR family transcriptional regulator [Phyllobacteriaceae bacterium]
MDWDDLRVFLAVARAGQLLGAANRLGVNHATVSRRIAALEKALGQRVIDRLTTGCRLTAAGQRLFAAAEGMEREALAATALGAAEEADLAGTVRLGAPDGFGVAWLAPRLAELARRHPRLSIELVPVPRSFSLSRREADLVVAVERPTEGRLVAVKLVDYALRLYASRAYARDHGLPREPADLSRHALVGYVPDLLISPALDYAAEFGAQWTPRLFVSSALGQVAAVRSGAGLGILHGFIAAGESELIAVPGFAPIMRSYWLAYPETLRELKTIRAVIAFLSDAIAADRAAFG